MEDAEPQKSDSSCYFFFNSYYRGCYWCGLLLLLLLFFFFRPGNGVTFSFAFLNTKSRPFPTALRRRPLAKKTLDFLRAIQGGRVIDSNRSIHKSSAAEIDCHRPLLVEPRGTRLKDGRWIFFSHFQRRAQPTPLVINWLLPSFTVLSGNVPGSIWFQSDRTRRVWMSFPPLSIGFASIFFGYCGVPGSSFTL